MTGLIELPDGVFTCMGGTGVGGWPPAPLVKVLVEGGAVASVRTATVVRVPARAPLFPPGVVNAAVEVRGSSDIGGGRGGTAVSVMVMEDNTRDLEKVVLRVGNGVPPVPPVPVA